MGRQITWPGRIAAGRPAAGRVRTRRSMLVGRIGLHLHVHPMEWILRARVAVATSLIIVAVVLYLLQANQATMLEMSLGNLQAKQANVMAENASLVVQADRLTAEPRIDGLAIRHHMFHPSLQAALWLTVYVPATVPHMPRVRPVRTGPLVWMQNAIRTVRNSL